MFFFTSCKPAIEDDFTRYLHSINEIKKPFYYNSYEALVTKSPNYDSLLYTKFKLDHSYMPYGKITLSDSLYLLVDCVASDGGTALIYSSYTSDGHKIDELNPYKKSGFDFGYQASEQITFNSDFTIDVVDSVYTWNINRDSSDVIHDSKKLTIGKTSYSISKKGLFESKPKSKNEE